MRGTTTCDVQLTLEIFHDVQEMVINIWLFLKLHFDGIEITQRIRYIQRSFLSCSWTDNFVGCDTLAT